MTGGSGAVTSFFGQPSVFFDPVRGFGPLTFDSGFTYTAFPSATVIPFSATASFLGLELGAPDGTHFGYAEFNGTDLVSYAFQTVAGGINAGALTAVPEPASMALFAIGLAAFGFFLRRQNKSQS